MNGIREHPLRTFPDPNYHPKRGKTNWRNSVYPIQESYCIEQQTQVFLSWSHLKLMHITNVDKRHFYKMGPIKNDWIHIEHRFLYESLFILSFCLLIIYICMLEIKNVEYWLQLNATILQLSCNLFYSANLLAPALFPSMINFILYFTTPFTTPFSFKMMIFDTSRQKDRARHTARGEC